MALSDNVLCGAEVASQNIYVLVETTVETSPGNHSFDNRRAAWFAPWWLLIGSAYLCAKLLPVCTRMRTKRAYFLGTIMGRATAF